MSKITQKHSVVNSTPLTELIGLLPGWLLPQMPKHNTILILFFLVFSKPKTVSHGRVGSTWRIGKWLVVSSQAPLKSWASNSWYLLRYGQNTEVQISWVFLLLLFLAVNCCNSGTTWTFLPILDAILIYSFCSWITAFQVQKAPNRSKVIDGKAPQFLLMQFVSCSLSRPLP